MELLICAKDGKIKAISFDEAWGDSEKLLAEGWEHTHTINPATFLQFIEVFEKIHGYSYTIFTKMLTPSLMLDWHQTTRLCELLVIRPEDGHIFERIPIVDLAHLQVIVDAFNQR